MPGSERGGVGVGNFLRRAVEPAFLHGGELGERALPAEKALVASPHAVAGLEAFRRRPHRLDHARQIAADDERLGQIPLDKA